MSYTTCHIEKTQPQAHYMHPHTDRHNIHIDILTPTNAHTPTRHTSLTYPITPPKNKYLTQHLYHNCIYMYHNTDRHTYISRTHTSTSHVPAMHTHIHIPMRQTSYMHTTCYIRSPKHIEGPTQQKQMWATKHINNPWSHVRKDTQHRQHSNNNNNKYIPSLPISKTNTQHTHTQNRRIKLEIKKWGPYYNLPTGMSLQTTCRNQNMPLTMRVTQEQQKNTMI